MPPCDGFAGRVITCMTFSAGDILDEGGAPDAALGPGSGRPRESDDSCLQIGQFLTSRFWTSNITVPCRFHGDSGQEVVQKRVLNHLTFLTF